MKLPRSFTTVTSFSKILALFLFIFLPFIGFYLGYKYSQSVIVPSETKFNYKDNNQVSQDSSTINSTTTPSTHFLDKISLTYNKGKYILVKGIDWRSSQDEYRTEFPALHLKFTDSKEEHDDLVTIIDLSSYSQPITTLDKVLGLGMVGKPTASDLRDVVIDGKSHKFMRVIQSAGGGYDSNCFLNPVSVQNFFILQNRLGIIFNTDYFVEVCETETKFHSAVLDNKTTEEILKIIESIDWHLIDGSSL